MRQAAFTTGRGIRLHLQAPAIAPGPDPVARARPPRRTWPARPASRHLRAVLACLAFALPCLAFAPPPALAGGPDAAPPSAGMTSDTGTAPDSPAASGPKPRRVVSVNLCTDQLAMLVAAPGQLISVSVLARDPLSSAMAQEAAAYPANHGLAEEIFLLRPDLVLTEPWTRPATVELLRRLGVPVAVIQPASSVADIPRALLQTGTALGQEARARQLAGAFTARLETLKASAPELRPRAALYQANGYTSGPQTLAGDILAAAGLSNIADGLGLDWGGHLPLEQLVMAQPDLVLRSRPYPGASHAEEILDHPALTTLRQQRRSADISDSGWICGTPAVLSAIEELISLHSPMPGPAAAAPVPEEP